MCESKGGKPAGKMKVKGYDGLCKKQVCNNARLGMVSAALVR